MNDAEFRTLLHDRLSPALDELSAPDLLSGVRARQVQHKRSVRAGLVSASVVGVAAVVVAVAAWPQSESSGPTAPAAPSLSVTAVPSAVASAAPSAAAPSPSTPVVDLTGLAPLVTTGQCAGLTVGAFVESRDLHPAITAVTATGATFTIADAGGVDLNGTGPCVDRVSYIERTTTFQNGLDVPYPLNGGGVDIVGQAATTNETGIVQLFLDCKGLVCSGSGAPLATVTVRVRGTGLGVGSQPFYPPPSPLPVPTGETATVPSVLGMSMEGAFSVLDKAGTPVVVATVTGTGSTHPQGPGVVLSQSPRAGAVVPLDTGEYLTMSVDGPAASSSVNPSSVARPSLPLPAPSLPAHAAMPSVLGLTLSRAQTLLGEAGIYYRVVYAQRSAPLHTVTDQYPKAGGVVTSSTVVQLTVSLGP